MTHALVTKLRTFTDLSEDDVCALDELAENAFLAAAGSVLISEGDKPTQVFMLLEGWAFRYKVTADGRRQIIGFLIPGDLCDVHVFVLAAMDHCIGLLSAAKVATIEPARMLEIMEQRPKVARALWWAALVDAAVLREWLVALGQRDAYERVAHLLCELRLRLHTVGLVHHESFNFPLTQVDLGQTMGLTSVSVNRSLQRLRSEGLITLSRRVMTIHEPQRLADACGFDPTYLHVSPKDDDGRRG